jgi:UDP-N-acetylglucosamine 2-epimerase (non-hydrolysing)
MTETKTIFFVIGTRPELIKLAPVIIRFREDPAFRSLVCFTGQHRELLWPTAHFFSIVPDIDLDLMQPNQSLSGFITKAILNLEAQLIHHRPHLVVVQGDTSSVLAGALAAFYQKIPVAHVEAGLRSGDMHQPFPEEMNRGLTSRLATIHFAPTYRAQENLEKEGFSKNIIVTGNTVIDALYIAMERILPLDSTHRSFFQALDLQRPIILCTVHRRENLGDPLESILEGLVRFAGNYPEIQIVIPVHPNPNIKEVFYQRFQGQANFYLFEAFEYPALVWLMKKCRFIVTDSGGIQEEAPTLQKPVLVLRKTTERQESLAAGISKLVPLHAESIFLEMQKLYLDEGYYSSFIKAESPYGDGQASARILSYLKDWFHA